MEKLKKCVTILAIAGTIGVTALFLMYPLRSIIRELLKKEVSLSEDFTQIEASSQYINSTQNTDSKQHTEEDNRVGEIWEAASYNIETIANSSLLQENADSIEMTLQLKTKNQSNLVHLWKSEEENSGYFFMPSYAKLADCEISFFECSIDGNIMINGNRVQERDILRDIEWDRRYSLQIYDAQEHLLADTSFTIYCVENLPSVFIDTKSGNMDSIHNDIDYKEPGQLIIQDVNGEGIYQGSLKEVKGRGNTTWNQDKKPYQIKLHKSADLFGFGEEDEWNLLSNGYDDTQFRNMLAFSMGEKAGLKSVPQGTLVSLYCNGDYKGNYYFCEKVKIGKERLDIYHLEDEILSVYQKTELKKLQSTESADGLLRWVDIDYNPEDISGGYLLSRELPFRYEEDVICGFKTTQGDHYEIVSPKYASYEQVSYIAGLMQELHDAVDACNGINLHTGRHYTEYLDMDSFADKYLIEEITKNYDGGATSSFFYKPADRESTKIFAGPIWDYDLVFGNNTQDKINSNPAGLTLLTDHPLHTVLFRDLYQKVDFKDTVKDRYRKSFSAILEEMLNVQIAEIDQIYRNAVLHNNFRWSSLYNPHRHYRTYEENIRYLRYFIESRKNFLDEVWIQDVTYHCVSFYVDGVVWRRSYVKDGETPEPIQVPYREDSLFKGFTDAQTGGQQFDEYWPIYGDKSFYAQWESQED